jgi:hypothetical protein
MGDKKHIDRLFQESFKDFEAVPSNAVWENIEAKLNTKKKQRRVIPIWWRYAGAAALLLLLLTIGSVFLNNSDEASTNQVVDIENTSSEDIKMKHNNSLNNASDAVPVVSDNNAKNALQNTPNTQPETITKDRINSSKAPPTIAKTPTLKAKNENKPNAVSNNKLNLNKKPISPHNNTIANSTEGNSSKNLKDRLGKTSQIANHPEIDNTKSDIKKENTLRSKEQAKSLLITELPKEETAVAANNKKNDANTNENPEDNKRSIEEALNSAKDIIEKEDKLNNRWSIAPNAAPVYFNTLGEGSSIDPQFNSNSKSGEVNMSYGISASYAINKKLSIRSGINKVNLSYNTNDVVIFQSVGSSARASTLQSIDSNTAEDVSFLSSENIKDGLESIVSSNASINQSLGYIEIPLELQYALSNRKLGINLIGGFSSFFLNNNEIFSEKDNGPRTLLGEANNINKVSYSANFGLGLNYKVSKRFNLNLEPIFKYKLNTFNNTSGNFSPFFIGVYTGLAIKF